MKEQQAEAGSFPRVCIAMMPARTKSNESIEIAGYRLAGGSSHAKE